MIKEINIQEWQLYTEKSANNSPFLHKEWLSLLSAQYQLPKVILGYFENDILVSAIPFVEKKTVSNKTKLISLPFTDYISFTEHIPDQFVLELKDSLPEKYDSIELRSYVSFLDNSESTFYRHYLELGSGYDNIRRAYKKHTQRNIKKSSKNNLTFKISTDLDAVYEFYKLNILTRKKHGLPPQPKGFFKNVHKYLFENKLGFVATVYYQEKAIASSIFFTNKNVIIYKYGASDSNSLFLRPNNFLFDSMVRYACENNYDYFDFGICSKDNPGLRRFKLGWGAREEDITYVLIDEKGLHTYNKKNYNKFLHFVLKISPSKLNVLLGEIFYKFAI